MVENELLQRLRKGDESAFALVYHRYGGRVFANILRLVKDKAQAEDLLQDVFVRVWQYRATIDEQKSFKSYLFAISKNLVYNYFRRASLETQVAAYIASQSSELYRHVDEQVQYHESHQIIEQAIQSLPPKRREVYMLCKIQGMSYEEASKLLGCSVAAINAHIVKATKAIKKQVGLSESAMLLAIASAVAQQL
ncbi:RNA polymerase sigma factor [Parapedobacter sp. 2B3]|uniref:RNA polymerase sigma factor n=1 Tax=Parapedobacter sp. 2B3 TaxID=3342381 RepID=UPI0035B67E21